MMGFVERLRPYSVVGSVIPCPTMTLEAGDQEPPIVVGSGEIVIGSTTDFSYTMRGVPADFGHAMHSLNRRRHDPYDGLLRQRLTVMTADGVELHCGWTEAKVRVPDGQEEWFFEGEFEAISIVDPGPSKPGTDVAYLLPKHDRARIILRRFLAPLEGDGRATRSMTVLGTEVTVTLDDAADLLTISAPATAELPATFAEGWFGEPLRILFGQLIYPRFVQRRVGVLTHNWVRQSPEWSSVSNASALWQGERHLIDREQFWRSYARLLAYIAAQRDKDGHPNFEANKISELYGEVIQAAHGSRWVWALTFASAAEGLVEIISPRGSLRPDLASVDTADLRGEISRFKAHVDLWTGDPQLKEPAKRAASRMLETTAKIVLRQLRATGWITADQFKAWDTLRNQVMHGKLVSPYSSAQDDKLLLDLAGLLHAITRRIIAGIDPATGLFVASPEPATASPDGEISGAEQSPGIGVEAPEADERLQEASTGLVGRVRQLFGRLFR